VTERPRTTLLTGGTGFVGANLARRLLHDGHRVHMLVRDGHTGWRIEGIRREVTLHTADLADSARLSAVVRDVRPEWVFHLAAYGAYSEQSDAARIFQANVVGTVNLVEACLREGFEAFVNTGSSSEYGFKDHPPHEGETVEPNSHYAVSKASATMFCRYAAQRHGAHIPTLRLYSVYGPFEQPTRLIPTMIVRGLEKTLPPLVNPDIARDFVFVDDVAEAYLLAATAPGQRPGAVYNVGSGMQTRIAELVELARTLLEIEELPRWGSMQDRQWDTRTWVADSSLIRETLLWRPETSLRHGLLKTLQWLQADPRMLRFYRGAFPGAR
jgi:nucleoside-diphosphate-sugar epimerase